jgi:hypothetical protein
MEAMQQQGDHVVTTVVTSLWCSVCTTAYFMYNSNLPVKLCLTPSVSEYLSLLERERDHKQ